MYIAYSTAEVTRVNIIRLPKWHEWHQSLISDFFNYLTSMGESENRLIQTLLYMYMGSYVVCWFIVKAQWYTVPPALIISVAWFSPRNNLQSTVNGLMCHSCFSRPPCILQNPGNGTNNRFSTRKSDPTRRTLGCLWKSKSRSVIQRFIKCLYCIFIHIFIHT